MNPLWKSSHPSARRRADIYSQLKRDLRRYDEAWCLVVLAVVLLVLAFFG